MPPTSTAPDPHASESAAPLWHAAGLVFVIVSVAVTGTVLTWNKNATTVAPPSTSRLFAAYLPYILVNGLLVLYVSRLGRGRSFLSELMGWRWTSAARAVGDVVLAFAAWLTIEALEAASVRLLGAAPGTTRSLLPTTELERIGFALFAITAGFCEEVVYRGYLQRELGAWTTPRTGVLLQALLFGLAHVEQGGFTAVRLGLYGLGLGVLARRRGSLLPCILCHIGIDLASLWLR